MPCRIYADFESIIRKLTTDVSTENGSFPNKCQINEQRCLPLYIASSIENDKFEPNAWWWTQEEASNQHIETLKTVEQPLVKRIQKAIKLIMPDKDIEEFSQATDCHLCGKELGDDKVRGHCELSGAFRGASHRKRNLFLHYNKD